MVAAGTQSGLGGELTLNVIPDRTHVSWGGFSQGEAANLRQPRFDAGAQATFSGLFGLELGASYSGADATHARSLGLHLGPYLALPFTKDDTGVPTGSVALRVNMPLLAFDAAPRPPIDVECVITVKLAFNLAGHMRWAFG